MVKLRHAVITATMSTRARSTLSVYPNPAHTRRLLRLPDQVLRAGLRLGVMDATSHPVLPQPLTALAGLDVPVEIGAQQAYAVPGRP